MVLEEPRPPASPTAHGFDADVALTPYSMPSDARFGLAALLHAAPFHRKSQGGRQARAVVRSHRRARGGRKSALVPVGGALMRDSVVRFAVVGTAALDRCCCWAGRVNSGVGPLLSLGWAGGQRRWTVAAVAGRADAAGVAYCPACRPDGGAGRVLGAAMPPRSPWPVPATAREHACWSFASIHSIVGPAML